MKADKAEKEVEQMNVTSTLCYTMQMDSIPSPYSYTIVESGTGALFCEEDSIPLDICEIAGRIRNWRRRKER
jgi:hypothetical protein